MCLPYAVGGPTCRLISDGGWVDGVHHNTSAGIDLGQEVGPVGQPCIRVGDRQARLYVLQHDIEAVAGQEVGDEGQASNGGGVGQVSVASARLQTQAQILSDDVCSPLMLIGILLKQECRSEETLTRFPGSCLRGRPWHIRSALELASCYREQYPLSSEHPVGQSAPASLGHMHAPTIVLLVDNLVRAFRLLLTKKVKRAEAESAMHSSLLATGAYIKKKATQKSLLPSRRERAGGLWLGSQNRTCCYVLADCRSS